LGLSATSGAALRSFEQKYLALDDMPRRAQLVSVGKRRRRRNVCRALNGILLCVFLFCLRLERRAPWQLKFVGVVANLQNEYNGCLGSMTATFMDIEVEYVSCSETATASAKLSCVASALELRKFRSLPKKYTVLLIFDVSTTLFESETAADSILKTFVAYADHSKIYIPVVSDADALTSLHCPGVAGMTMIGRMDTLQTIIRWPRNLAGDMHSCDLQLDHDRFFFDGSYKWSSVGLAPLRVVLPSQIAWAYTTFFQKRYPSTYVDVANRLSERVSALQHWSDHSMCQFTNSQPPSKSSEIRIYWLNLKQSKHRRKLMEEHMETVATRFRISSTRIEATSESDIFSYVNKSTLPSWVKISRKFGGYEDHVRNKYSTLELACLHSHVTAIKTAYAEGVDYALIMEDDIRLHDMFLVNFEKYVGTAPVSWQILQLYMINIRALGVLLRIRHSNFVTWFPGHWSTGAYVINRRGMQRILHAFETLLNVQSNSGAVSSLEHALLADEFLYLHTESLTATFPAAHAVHVRSTIQGAGAVDVRKIDQLYDSKERNCVRRAHRIPDSLLLFSTARVTSLASAEQVLDRMIDNVESLRRLIEKVDLVIFLIVTSDHLQYQVQQMLSRSELTNITVEVRMRFRRFNKFWYLRSVIPFVVQYDKLMLLDSDIAMKGFPIHDFFQRIHHGIVGGALRKSVKDGLLTNAELKPRHWFAMFSAGDWIQFMDAEVLELPFIEMYFAVLDAKFAHWFFLQILSDKYFHRLKSWRHLYSTEALESDFGPDIMWCGAAADWTKLTLSSKRPCLLALLTLEHTDDRQIELQSVDVHNKRVQSRIKKEEQAPLRAYRREFSKWFDYSNSFRLKIGGVGKFDDDFISYLNTFRFKSNARCVIHAS